MTKDKKLNSEEKVEELLSDALSGMTEEECFGWEEEPSISPDELEVLAMMKKHKRRKKLTKYLGLATAAVLICVIGCITIIPKITAVEANKNKQDIVEENNGTVIIQEKEGKDLPEDQDTVSVWEITDWDSIEAHKEKYVPEMLIPKWIPEGYEFDRLIIERFYNGLWKYEYQFETKQGEELGLAEAALSENGTNTFFQDPDRTVETELGIIYISEYEGEDIIAGSVRNEETWLYITGEGISNKELIQIFNNLK